MNQLNDIVKEISSFRDNAGFVFYSDKDVYRVISKDYIQDYDLLINSGLAKYLVEKEYLIGFKETKNSDFSESKTLIVDKVPNISYSYEWSFSMLKDAALLTLEILQISLSYGMILKDASSYNIQFYNGKPILIDITSFTKYQQGTPWVAYQQFCKHFLSPLLLMAKTDISLNKLMMLYLDGIPLKLTSKLLPWKSRFNISIYLHIHLHARFIEKYNNTNLGEQKKTVNSNVKNICNNLKQLVESLGYFSQNTEWAEYYEKSVGEEYLSHKRQVFTDYLTSLNPKKVWDLGANNGKFSQIAAEKAEIVIATDIDTVAIERLYVFLKQEKIKNILPIVLDITNPSASIGWNNQERPAFKNRINCDLVIALAVIHHFRITYHIPLDYQAKFFAENCENMIIEFVPKEDNKVQTLLQNREDIFTDYNIQDFETIFGNYFTVIKKTKISNSSRILYILSKKKVE